MSDAPLTLDVSDDLRQGREPFGKIMAAVDQLRPGQALRLLLPIEPTPLLAVMRRRGFASTTRTLGADQIEVLFVPIPGVPRGPAPAAHPSCPACPGSTARPVDPATP